VDFLTYEFEKVHVPDTWRPSVYSRWARPVASVSHRSARGSERRDGDPGQKQDGPLSSLLGPVVWRSMGGELVGKMTERGTESTRRRV